MSPPQTSDNTSTPDEVIVNIPVENTNTSNENTRTDSTMTSAPSQNASASTLPSCREDFFREEGSDSCVPSCYTWHEYSEAEVIVTDVVTGLSAVIGFVSGLVIIVISSIRFKRMYVQL